MREFWEPVIISFVLFGVFILGGVTKDIFTNKHGGEKFIIETDKRVFVTYSAIRVQVVK